MIAIGLDRAGGASVKAAVCRRSGPRANGRKAAGSIATCSGFFERADMLGGLKDRRRDGRRIARIGAQVTVALFMRRKERRLAPTDQE